MVNSRAAFSRRSRTRKCWALLTGSSNTSTSSTGDSLIEPERTRAAGEHGAAAAAAAAAVIAVAAAAAAAAAVDVAAAAAAAARARARVGGHALAEEGDAVGAGASTGGEAAAQRAGAAGIGRRRAAATEATSLDGGREGAPSVPPTSPRHPELGKVQARIELALGHPVGTSRSQATRTPSGTLSGVTCMYVPAMRAAPHVQLQGPLYACELQGHVQPQSLTGRQEGVHSGVLLEPAGAAAATKVLLADGRR
jgi:hypothetical protein